MVFLAVPEDVHAGIIGNKICEEEVDSQGQVI